MENPIEKESTKNPAGAIASDETSKKKENKNMKATEDKKAVKKDVKKAVKSIETLKKEAQALTKDNKSLDKELDKEAGISKRTSKDALKKATIEAGKVERAERKKLNADIREAKKDRTAKRIKITAMQKGNASGIRELEKIRGTFGLHPNSPKNLSTNPWTFAIPTSIIKTTNADYPGVFSPIKKEGANKPYKLESETITLNFDDHVLFQVLSLDEKGKIKTFSRDYSQGLTRWLQKVLKDEMKLAA